MTSLTIELLNIGTSCHYACEIQQVLTPLRLVLASLSYLFKPHSPDGFWKLWEEICSTISDKSDHINYLLANRDVAMRQNILF